MGMLLTDIQMRGLAKQTTRRQIADSKAPGLVVRTESSGRPTFHVRKMIRGHRRKVQIGVYPTMGLADARITAARWLEAWEAGLDAPDGETVPRATVSTVQPIDNRKTVKQAITDWQAACDSPRDPNRWSAKHALGVARTVRVEILPKLGDRFLSETTREDWTALVIAKRATAPAMASLLYRHISAFLNFADAVGWGGPLLSRKGLSVIAPLPKARERKLEDAELVAIWRACDSLSVRQRALVRVLILTGARLDEVACITPGEIDFTAKRWALPDARSKNGQGYVIPLCPLAINELRAVAADLGRFSSFSKLKARLDEKAGVTGWRFHDLRRSLRSWCSANEIPIEHAEAAINHVGVRGGLVGVYDQHDYAPQVIRVLTQWQEHITRIVGGDGGNVIDLRRARRSRPSPFLLPGASPAGR